MSVDVEVVEPGRRWTARVSGHSAAEVEESARLGDLHRSHAWLEAPEDVDPVLLRELAAALAEAAGVPLAVKAVPGTPRHAQLVAAGGTAYEVVPPSLVDCTDPANAAWAASAVTDPPAFSTLADVAPEAILDLWLTIYTWMHADWSPLHDQELVVCEAVDPHAPDSHGDVTAGLRAVVDGARAAGWPAVLFDGHVSDPHFNPALQEIPHRSGQGLHLLQLGLAG